ncbi:MAG TPA: ABC transporter permease [Gordonia sp. (in: high G+C Gram-positive bacteria)]|uniref:MlaE family ABC transporter permease n=1 Tax=unclassified Gordonia (in: high G+C Gram-positive bacteria) TaxID=2657482 RepID=UPI000F97E196|nr:MULTISPECIES: ABC transporter permease [unclassified Gordonia (in: high G+C Gram-positive bacteria)]RUP39874.1 MAG: ABC transporter permease [Gordonia sp. (in: high G+C Gram-positive bacteria)]HNP56723.1 ABC transporter permease [Gordonia sp. (in: high G+C Gram-positive bacteria)]HRC51646.1 ABC transporter permease [Gordonia sp. (in: high G+C Gram-positive bacteria)]
MTDVLATRYPRAARRVGAPERFLKNLGRQAVFYRDAVRQIPHALRYYATAVLQLIAEIGMGTGALAIIGGTVVIVGFMTFSAGTLLAIQGFASLGDIGVEALTGFFAAFINVRIAAPVTAGIALAATIGAGATAQLGAMRISEEIDALEVMAINSMSYLVSTRLIGGVIAIIPLYSVAVLMSFLASRFYTIFINGQSAGVYDHYFSTFLRPSDLVWSFAQAILMGLVVMGIHCYHGYNAAGGPAGVGVAVGRAVRSSLIAVVIVCLLVSLAIYGTSGNLNLAG